MQKFKLNMSHNLLITAKLSQQKTKIVRFFSLNAPNLFRYSELQIKTCEANERKAMPDWSKIEFGRHFSDHMFEVEWTDKSGWQTPQICPLHNLSLHPSAKVLHYSVELFEGLKAYRGVDQKVRLFRPQLNMKRMRGSAQRIDLPDFDDHHILACLKKLLEIDSDWVPPHQSNASLYIRPTYIGTEAALGVHSSKHALLYIICCPVGPYFSTGFKPISLLADPAFVRSWPGGSGDKKLGSNYGPTLAIQKLAEKRGFHQVLWLFGDDHQLTEVGNMNIFVVIINDNGERELITPPLDSGLILPGITRLSLLELAREWNQFIVTERKITMNEIRELLKQKRLLEMFGSGTASVVCSVGRISYMNEDLIIPTLEQKDSVVMKFFRTLTDIQFGKTPHEWAVIL